MSRPQVDVDFGARSFLADPFPVYEEIRAAGRVVWNGTLNVWMVPGFEDCKRVLGDRGETFAEMTADVSFWFQGAKNMITVDGDEHARLRNGLKAQFTKQAVARWERRVVEVVDEVLLPLLKGRSDFDLIADFTKIPTIIVAEMLGVPPERHEDFRRWSRTIAGGLAYGFERPEVLAAMHQASDEINEYLTEEIERHRREQLDDVFGAMLKLPELTHPEMRAAALSLLLAGYDTTAKLMSSALVVLEQHPEQRRLLAENPELMPSAIEEVLRWRGTSQMNPRAVVRETELAGTALAPGDAVYALQGAANRDPARWPEPERFDITRASKSHLGFGYGPHLCIGLWLARLESKVALQRLLEIAPEYHLRDVENGPSAFVYGPERGFVDIHIQTAA
jgi:cytochrome P450